MERKQIGISNEERAGVATWLVLQQWGGSEEELSTILAVYDALKIEEYRSGQTPEGRFTIPVNLMNRTVVNYEVTEAMGHFILAAYPGQATPSALGPAKVRLLQRLRKAFPPPKPPSREIPADEAAPAKKRRKAP